MIWTIVVLVIFFFIVRTMARQGLPRGRPNTPIEPAQPRPTLPDAAERAPALRDGKATLETLMEDFAEGRISVEEYERRVDHLYKKDQR